MSSLSTLSLPLLDVKDCKVTDSMDSLQSLRKAGGLLQSSSWSPSTPKTHLRSTYFSSSTNNLDSCGSICSVDSNKTLRFISWLTDSSYTQDFCGKKVQRATLSSFRRAQSETDLNSFVRGRTASVEEIPPFPLLRSESGLEELCPACCDRSRAFSDEPDLACHTCEDGDTRRPQGFFSNNGPETDAHDLLWKDMDVEWPPRSSSAFRFSPMAFTDGTCGWNGGPTRDLPRTSSFLPGHPGAHHPPPGGDFVPEMCSSEACDSTDRRLPATDCAEESGGGLGGAHGGRFTGKGGGRGGDNEDGGLEGTGMNPTESYYQKALQANPGHPLLLGNYARFLFEAGFPKSVHQRL